MAPRKKKETGETIFEPCDIAQETAYEIYCEMKAPSMRVLYAEVIKRHPGAKVSMPTLQRWKKAHRWEERRISGSTASIGDLVIAMRAKSLAFTAEDIRGLQGALVIKVHASLESMQINTPSEAQTMVDVLQELHKLHHSLRGDEIGQRGAEPVPDDERRAFPAARTPIEIPSFKPRAVG